jgi:hypothetical protein
MSFLLDIQYHQVVASDQFDRSHDELHQVNHGMALVHGCSLQGHHAHIIQVLARQAFCANT